MALSSTPVVFNFVSNTLRVVMRDGEPWFVAADVCAALGISRTDDGVGRLDDDEKDADSIRTPGGDQEMTVINESGLYALVLRSRKPEARKFAKWVTSEVLPAIRKTGSYTAPQYKQNPGDSLTVAQADVLRDMLKTAVEKLPHDQQAGAMVKGWSKLKAHFGCGYREIPQAAFTEAVSLMARHIAHPETPTDQQIMDMLARQTYIVSFLPVPGYETTMTMRPLDAAERIVSRESLDQQGLVVVKKSAVESMTQGLNW